LRKYRSGPRKAAYVYIVSIWDATFS